MKSPRPSNARTSPSSGAASSDQRNQCGVNRPSGKAANAIVIPNAAVQRGPDGLFAWVITAKNVAEPHPIQTGPVAGDIPIVTSVLNDGERVVTDGQYKLQKGALVTVLTAPAAAGSS